MNWRSPNKQRRRLLALRRPDRLHQSDVVAKARVRRPGWAWTGLRKVLAESTVPVTPSQACAKLAEALGEPVALSTVKNCLTRDAKPGHELMRLEGGRYLLRHDEG